VTRQRADGCLRQRRAAGASSVRYTATQQTADAAVDNL